MFLSEEISSIRVFNYARKKVDFFLQLRSYSTMKHCGNLHGGTVHLLQDPILLKLLLVQEILAVGPVTRLLTLGTMFVD